MGAENAERVAVVSANYGFEFFTGHEGSGSSMAGAGCRGPGAGGGGWGVGAGAGAGFKGGASGTRIRALPGPWAGPQRRRYGATNPNFFKLAAGSSPSNFVNAAFSRPFSSATPNGYAVYENTG